MHSHDRTMIASFGFADPDKKSGKHDLACQYLAVPSVTAKIAEMCGCRSYSKSPPTFREVASVHLEVPITKGEGQYRTVVGFADCLIESVWNTMVTYNTYWREGKKCGGVPEPSSERVSILCEVKIARCNSGDAIRQLNLYRGFLGPHSTVIVSAFNWTESDAAAFEREKIKVLSLGQGFDEFCDHAANVGEHVCECV